MIGGLLIGFGVVFGLLATQPEILWLCYDLLLYASSGQNLIRAADCAQELARERALAWPAS